MAFSPELRSKILLLHELSCRQIGKYIGRRHTSVARFLRTSSATPNMAGKRERPSRRVRSARDEHIIKRIILTGKCHTATEISHKASNLGLRPCPIGPYDAHYVDKAWLRGLCLANPS